MLLFFSFSFNKLPHLLLTWFINLEFQVLKAAPFSLQYIINSFKYFKALSFDIFEKFIAILLGVEKADVDPRPRVSEMCKGPKRLESESYEDYKVRMKVENELVNQYLNGYITYGKK